MGYKERVSEIQREIIRLKKEESDLLDKIEREKTNYDRFLTTYGYRELTSKHSLFEKGIWEIRGEDSNADLAGPHSNPFLGYYEGELEKVIRVAVEIPGFWSWGGGGYIKLHTPRKVTKVE